MFLGNETTCPNGHKGNFIYNPNAAGSAPILTCAICGQVINVQTNQFVQFPIVATSGHQLMPQAVPTWDQLSQIEAENERLKAENAELNERLDNANTLNATLMEKCAALTAELETCQNDYSEVVMTDIFGVLRSAGINSSDDFRKALADWKQEQERKDSPHLSHGD